MNIEYALVEGYEVDAVVKDVQELLANGWVCAGGISTSLDHGEIHYAQALTRKSE